MATFVVLLGPPGAGKGTQAKRLAKELHVPHISSGDIFRENLGQHTPLGEQARGYMSRGELVPDDLTIEMIRERLSRPDCAEGAILDGFPRTPAQAEALQEMLEGWGSAVAAVLYIRVPDDVLIDRLSGRWLCRAEGHIYHASLNPPREAGVCDIDGSQLYQREDDQPQTVAQRVRVYHEQTAPLVDYYRSQSLLREVDGAQPIATVTQALLDTLEADG